MKNKATKTLLALTLILSFASAASQGTSENPFYQSEMQAQATNDPGDPPLGEDPLDADPVPLDDWLPWLGLVGFALMAATRLRRTPQHTGT